MNSHVAMRYKIGTINLLTLISALALIFTLTPTVSNAQDNLLAQQYPYPSNFAIDGGTDVRPVLLNITRIFSSLLILLALIFILYTGIRLLRIPADDLAKRKTARRRLIIGVVVLVVLIILYAFASFVVSSVIAQTI